MLKLLRGERGKRIRRERLVRDGFGLAVLSRLVPKGDGADGGDADGSMLIWRESRQCLDLGGGGFTVQTFGLIGFARTESEVRCARQPLTTRVVVGPSHANSTSARIISRAANPTTPATAGRLLSPRRACSTFCDTRWRTSRSPPAS